MATILEDQELLVNEHAATRSIWPTAGQYGLIASVVSFAFTLLFYNLGMMDLGDDGTSDSVIPSIVGYAVLGAIAYLGVRAFRDSDGRSYLPTIRGIKWSAGFGLISGLVSLVLSYVFFAFIAPEYLEQMQNVVEMGMEDQGMSASDIESAQKGMGIFMNPGVLAITGGLGGFVTSFIAGSIMTLFLKTE